MAGGLLTGGIALWVSQRTAENDRKRDQLADQRHLRDAKHDRLLVAYRELARAATSLEGTGSLAAVYVSLSGLLPPAIIQQLEEGRTGLREAMRLLELESDPGDEVLMAATQVLVALSLVRYSDAGTQDALGTGPVPQAERAETEKQARELNRLAQELTGSARAHLENYRTPL